MLTMGEVFKLKSCKASSSLKEEGYNNIQGLAGTTPISSKKLIESNEYYLPLLSQYSQEECEDIDVVWDWQSPQSKPRIFKKKRIVEHHSPQLLRKRSPPHNQKMIFKKLEEQLQSLTDDSDTVKILTKFQCESEIGQTSQFQDLEELLNDSMEEQLIMCSQNVEHNLNQDQECKSSSENKTPKNFDAYLNTIADDSFDFILETIKDEELRLHDQDHRHVSSATCDEFKTSDKLPIQNSFIDKSPIKCSPEEIEKKRLQALAKLQAKKQRDIIERNRQEALKRLKFTKKKRALIF